MLKKLGWSEVPSKSSLSEWASQYNVKRDITKPSTRAALIADANKNLADLLRRLRSLGVAVHLREVIALRAAQIIENDRLAEAMKSKKLAMLPTSRKAAETAATLRAARTGDAFDRDKLDTIVADAIAIADERARSYVIHAIRHFFLLTASAGPFCLRRGRRAF